MKLTGHLKCRCRKIVWEIVFFVGCWLASNTTQAAEIVRNDNWKMDVSGVLAGHTSGMHLFWPWQVVAGAPALGAFGWDSRDGLTGNSEIRLQFSGRFREDVLAWDVQTKVGFGLFSQPNMASIFGQDSATAAAEPPRSLPLQYTDSLEKRTLFASIDRLWVRTRVGPADILLGRQAIGFGVGLIWQPADLLGTFSPLAIDREFKPGVDALRVNFTFGQDTELALVVAPGAFACLHTQRPTSANPLLPSVWQTPFGEPCSPGELRYDAEATSGLVRLRTTISEFDIGLLAGTVRGDLIGGTFTAGTIGRWKFSAEVTFTHDQDANTPDNDDVSFRRNFMRAVAGFEYHFDFQKPLHVYSAFYYNGYGSIHTEDYMTISQSARVAIYHEIVNFGRYYLGAGGLWELSDKLKTSLLCMGNLTDASTLVSLSLEFLLSNESLLYVGGLLPAGKRPTLITTDFIPTGLDPGSEFGMAPAMIYVLFKQYF